MQRAAVQSFTDLAGNLFMLKNCCWPQGLEAVACLCRKLWARASLARQEVLSSPNLLLAATPAFLLPPLALNNLEAMSVCVQRAVVQSVTGVAGDPVKPRQRTQHAAGGSQCCKSGFGGHRCWPAPDLLQAPAAEQCRHHGPGLPAHPL